MGSDHLLLAGEELLGLRGRITPGPSWASRGNSRNVAPRLFTSSLGCRPDVVSANDRSQAARGGNRLKAGDAGAHHQGARRVAPSRPPS